MLVKKGTQVCLHGCGSLKHTHTHEHKAHTHRLFLTIPSVHVAALRGVSPVLVAVTTEESTGDGLVVTCILPSLSNNSSGGGTVKSSCNIKHLDYWCKEHTEAHGKSNKM